MAFCFQQAVQLAILICYDMLETRGLIQTKYLNSRYGLNKGELVALRKGPDHFDLGQ
jgi:hypothetical protein